MTLDHMHHNEIYQTFHPYALTTCTAAAQGRDAMQAWEVVRNIGHGTAVGASNESVQLVATLKRIQSQLETLRASIDNRYEPPYDHVPLAPAFTVQATYKFVGKMKPRQFDLDE